jgi:hypothetical protein
MVPDTGAYYLSCKGTRTSCKARFAAMPNPLQARHANAQCCRCASAVCCMTVTPCKKLGRHSTVVAASPTLHIRISAMPPPRRLRVHEESNINPNSDCGFIYGYYWWIFCLNFLAWCGARASPPCLPLLCLLYFIPSCNLHIIWSLALDMVTSAMHSRVFVCLALAASC